MEVFLIGLFMAIAVVDHSSGKYTSKQNYCHSDDSSPYLYMGSKTSYDTVRGIDAIDSDSRSCNPVKFWSLLRHGTRIADLNSMQDFKLLPLMRDEIIRNHESDGLGSLCIKDLEVLRSWTWDETLEGLYNTLTEEGVRELETIAERYKKRVPDLMQQPYNESKFLFKYTNEQRTEASCYAFVSGLFGSDQEVQVEESEKYDPVIRSYKNCTAWNNEAKDRDEQKAFQLTPVFKQLTAEVSKRLGFYDSLDVSVITTMYDMCRYYKAWNPYEVSPWCVAFTSDHLIVLEYLDDLKHAYKSGYGRPINRQIGCSPIKNMMEMFTSYAVDFAEGPDVVAYFSHDTMMLLTLTALGVAKDVEIPTADNYERMSERKWRTSLIAAFATNLVGVLYKCNFPEEQYWVQMHLNEKPLNVCQNFEDSQGWCSWSEFQKRFSPFLQCDLKVCSV